MEIGTQRTLPLPQITPLTVSSGAAPFCCSDPGCPCEGGRAAKAALEQQQQAVLRETVRFSAQAQALLAAERTAAMSETAATASRTAAPVFSPLSAAQQLTSAGGMVRNTGAQAYQHVQGLTGAIAVTERPQTLPPAARPTIGTTA